MTHEMTALDTAVEPGIPFEIRAAYDISDAAQIQRLSGGLVNDTLLVHDAGTPTVMRRLSNVMEADVLTDTKAVSDHLVLQGWEAPLNLSTVDGNLHVADAEGFTWHRMNFIDSDGRTPAPHAALPQAAGELLGSWHASTRSLDYTPRFTLPHFHDTPYHAAKLLEHAPHLSLAGQDLAADILRSYISLPPVTETEPQIIHGDPKLDNMLFRDGKPFTLIDFDTIMKDSVWTDVGDFLRSMTGKLIVKSSAEQDISAFVTSYHESSDLQVSLDQASHHALRHTGRIALELGMRYLCDVVDGQRYFSWDPSLHANREDNHVARAGLQLQVARYVIERL